MGLAFSQPVSNMGIIPIGVTLNSILRLNIVSGGNIEFVVNTIDQYNIGIANSALYTTTFTVASSVDFDVALYSDNANLVGTNDAANIMPVDNIGYWITESGTYANLTNWTLISSAAPVADLLTNGTVTIVAGGLGLGAGSSTQNEFNIHWELATAAVTAAGGTSGTLLSQDLQSDRYVVNAFVVLSAN